MRHAQRQRLSVLHGVSQEPQEEDRQAWSSHRGCGTKPTHNTGEAKRLEPTTSPEAGESGGSVEGVPHRIVVAGTRFARTVDNERRCVAVRRPHSSPECSAPAIEGGAETCCGKEAFMKNRKKGRPQGANAKRGFAVLDRDEAL